MLIRNKILSRNYIEKSEIPTTPPAETSFFNRAWEANKEILTQTLNTNFLQGIKNGNLSPDAYGQLNVQDSVYCLDAVDTMRISYVKIDMETDPVFKELMAELIKGYVDYNAFWLDDWSIKGTDCIVPSDNFSEYITTERITAINELPIYLLVAYIPCYYLWYRMGDALKDYAEDNLYGGWITGNASYPDSAYMIGNFIEQWIAAGNEWDEEKAMRIYRTSMLHEFRAFDEAAKESQLEAFYKTR